MTAMLGWLVLGAVGACVVRLAARESSARHRDQFLADLARARAITMTNQRLRSDEMRLSDRAIEAMSAAELRHRFDEWRNSASDASRDRIVSWYSTVDGMTHFWRDGGDSRALYQYFADSPRDHKATDGTSGLA